MEWLAPKPPRDCPQSVRGGVQGPAPRRSLLRVLVQRAAPPGEGSRGGGFGKICGLFDLLSIVQADVNSVDQIHTELLYRRTPHEHSELEELPLVQ